MRGAARPVSVPGMEGTSSTWRERLIAAACCVLLALAFLWEPLTHLHDSHYAPSDIGGAFSLTRVGEPIAPKNEVLSDVYTQFHPWFLFQKEQLAAGRMPLWNPWNGHGLPHLANAQSAVLSPFAWPYYAFEFRYALLVAAFLKLFALSFCTYLFLRELRLDPMPAALGAVVYGFAAHHVLLIQFPHSGVAALIPAGLFVIERLARRLEAREPAATRRASWSRLPAPALFAAFVLVLALGVLAGHPETLGFALSVLVLYTLARAFGLWRARRSREQRREIVITGVQLVAGGVLAAGIASLVLLPFQEYLANSGAIAGRSGGQFPLGQRSWPIAFFPNLLGNPSEPYYVTDLVPRPAYTIATMAYVGGFAILCALVSLVFARARGAHLFFALLLACWIVYAYDLFHSTRVHEFVPLLKLLPITRSQPVAAISIAVCAAFGAQALSRLDGRRRWLGGAWVLGCGALILWVSRSAAFGIADEAARGLIAYPRRVEIPEGAARHVAAMSALFAIGAAALATCAAVTQVWLRRATLVVCVIVAFAQCGWLLRGFNPVTKDEFVYPRTAPIAELARRLGERTAIVLGDDSVPPAANSAHGLRQISYYDALSIGRYEALYRECFGLNSNWREVDRASTRALQLFGVDVVLDVDGWLEIDTAFGESAYSARAARLSEEILPTSALEARLVGMRAGLEGLRLRLEFLEPVPDCALELQLLDAVDGTELARAERRLQHLPSDAAGTLFAVLPIPRIENSFGRAFLLRVKSPDAVPGRAPRAVLRSDWPLVVQQCVSRAPQPTSSGHPSESSSGSIRGAARATDAVRPPTSAPSDVVDTRAAAWSVTQGGIELAGGLDCDQGFALDAFSVEGELPPFRVHAYRAALGRFHTVGRALGARDARESLRRALEPEFDPAREVLVEELEVASDGEPDALPAPPVRIDSERPGYFDLRVERERAGWLVACLPWYPGWSARIDGESVELSCANHAFSALRLPAGTHRVELVYESRSFELGVFVSLASALLLVAWSWWSARGRAS